MIFIMYKNYLFRTFSFVIKFYYICIKMLFLRVDFEINCNNVFF